MTLRQFQSGPPPNFFGFPNAPPSRKKIALEVGGGRSSIACIIIFKTSEKFYENKTQNWTGTVTFQLLDYRMLTFLYQLKICKLQPYILNSPYNCCFFQDFGLGNVVSENHMLIAKYLIWIPFPKFFIRIFWTPKCRRPVFKTWLFIEIMLSYFSKSFSMHMQFHQTECIELISLFVKLCFLCLKYILYIWVLFQLYFFKLFQRKNLDPKGFSLFFMSFVVT